MDLTLNSSWDIGRGHIPPGPSPLLQKVPKRHSLTLIRAVTTVLTRVNACTSWRAVFRLCLTLSGMDSCCFWGGWVQIHSHPIISFVLRLFQWNVAEIWNMQRSIRLSITWFHILDDASIASLNGAFTCAFLKAYPHYTIVVYDCSLWRMRLCHKSTIPARHLLPNVAICPKESYHCIGCIELNDRIRESYRVNGP